MKIGKNVDEELIREIKEVGHSDTAEHAVFEWSSYDPRFLSLSPITIVWRGKRVSRNWDQRSPSPPWTSFPTAKARVKDGLRGLEVLQLQ
jgi:hypothetical protein